MEERIAKINPTDVPREVFDVGSRVLAKSIRSFFSNPENQKGYEEWMKTPEGKRAEMSKEERAKYDAGKLKGARI